MKTRLAAAWVVLAAAAVAQDDERARSEARCRAVAEAQDAGKFDVAAALDALAAKDEGVARTAAAIVRHEWLVVPLELLDGLASRPAAARALLHELAIAPRPSLAGWVERWGGVDADRDLDDRCLALAARGTPITIADADLLLRALADRSAADGWRAAVAVLPPKVADAIVGKMHAGIVGERFDVDGAGPLLDRLSPDGLRLLLGLVVTLPHATASALCTRVSDQAPSLVADRARDSLDADAPFETIWLPFVAPLLDSPARTARIAALLHDERRDAATRDQAFFALVAAKAIDEPLLAYAAAEGDGRDTRMRRLLDAAIDQVPAARLVEWLQSAASSTRVAQALSRRRQLEPVLAAELLASLRAAPSVDGAFHLATAMAIVQRGDAATVTEVWPLLRGSSAFCEIVDVIGRRPEPFVSELLLAELRADAANVEPAQRAAQLDAVALALVARGDRRELERLVAHAKSSPPGFVRRCSHHARPLAKPFAMRLLAEALAASDADVATEMTAWAATAAAEPDVYRALRDLWRAPPNVEFAAELQDTALRALAAGPARGELVAELRTALAAGPLPDLLEPLGFELVGSMPSPPAANDLELAADLVLLQPRTDPAREIEQAARWPDGTSGFPLIAAVAERLRTAEPTAVAAVFAAAARAATEDPRHRTIAPARFVVLWRELAIVPAVQRAAGTATADLVLALQPKADVLGTASWFAMHAAVDRRDFAAARRHAQSARDGLLRLPTQRRHARVFLGERDPGGGADGWAALAAWPHVIDALAAAAAGDRDAARAASANATELAGRDVRITAMLPSPDAENAR